LSYHRVLWLGHLQPTFSEVMGLLQPVFRKWGSRTTSLLVEQLLKLCAGVCVCVCVCVCVRARVCVG
jgi:hypothetical protein